MALSNSDKIPSLLYHTFPSTCDIWRVSCPPYLRKYWQKSLISARNIVVIPYFAEVVEVQFYSPIAGFGKVVVHKNSLRFKDFSFFIDIYAYSARMSYMTVGGIKIYQGKETKTK